MRLTLEQMMIRQQDRTMNSIAGTLSTLAQQAGMMGQELEEHNESVVSFRFFSAPYVCADLAVQALNRPRTKCRRNGLQT